MLSFKQLLPLMEQTETNKHLDHIEDLMLLRGGSGLDNSIAFMKDIVQSLKTGSTSLGMSTKWDGKPAVICGIHPENKKFFVAIKGIFSKEVQKVFHTEQEIRKGFEIKELADKLVECLKYLPKIGIKTILQGDLMFLGNSKKSLTINGQPHIGFQPNTILYTVPKDSEIGRRVGAAKIGIAFHTEYSGKTLADIRATSFNFNANQLKQHPDVWFTDPNIYDLTPALLKGGEGDTAIRSISECEALAKKVKPFLKTLLARKDLMPMLLPYINSTINGGLTSFTSGGLKLYIKTKLEKEINKLKTEKGKQAKEAALNDLIAFIDAYDGQFSDMFELHNKIAKVKEIILAKMYAVSALGHFFVDADGIRPTDPEGIVIVRTGTAVKLVNRLRFSRQNRKINDP